MFKKNLNPINYLILAFFTFWLRPLKIQEPYLFFIELVDCGEMINDDNVIKRRNLEETEINQSLLGKKYKVNNKISN